MKNLYFLLVCLSFFTIESQAETSNRCLSGKTGQNNLIDQLNRAKEDSPVTNLILKKYPQAIAQERTEAGLPCTDCEESRLRDQTQPMGEIAGQIQGVLPAPKMLFKPQCLNIGAKFNSNTAEVSCPDGRSSRTRDLCIDDKFLTYLNSVISSFYACAQNENMAPVSPEILFQMYAKESAFKPQFAYNGGVGLGQLTNVFVKDNLQPWRGGKYLKRIAESKKPECDAAQVIASKDLRSAPSIGNLCSFISVGEGMERNILHTLVGLTTSWEKDIAPLLKDYLEKHKGHPALNDIKSLAVINAYGFGGRLAARAAVRRLTQFPPDKFREHMQLPLYGVRKSKQDGKERVMNYTEYTNGLAKRQKDIAQQFAEPLRSDFAKNKTRACINEVN